MDRVLNVDIAAANLLYLKEAVGYYGIKIVTGAAVSSLEDGRVTYSAGEEEKAVPADTVIVSIGYDSTSPIHVEGKEVYTIGDAGRVSNLLGAVWSAYETAMNV